MPHLHLSLQHGDDMILKRMKRRHSAADAIAFAEQVRRLRPGFAFGADMIAGFPTETEEMAANSARLPRRSASRICMSSLQPPPRHAGSPDAAARSGTRQGTRGGASRVAERLQAMHLASRVGTRQKLLVERNEMAHTEDFTLVAAPGMKPGSLIEVSIGGHNGRHLTIASAAASAAA